jgi:prevent-host-death family protein
MVKRVTATEAKSAFVTLLDEVAAGDEVEITRRGRTVARLVPATGPHSPSRHPKPRVVENGLTRLA